MTPPTASDSMLGSPAANSLMESVADTTSHRDRDSLNGAVARLILEFLDAESVTLYRFIDDQPVTRLMPLVAAARGTPEVSSSHPDDLSTLPTLDDVPSWKDCVRQRQVVQYQDAPGAEFAIFPIESAREVIGLLVLQCVNALAQRDVHLVGAILRILKNHMELLDYGERDTLTHMLNRKTFPARFAKLQRPVAGSNATEFCWLGLVDIDKFKSINDSHGHLFGDEVLLLLSQIMQQCFRGADQLFRFGGEEFVIVLDRATPDGARIAFERLREAVECFRFPQVGRVTVSLGYTQIRPDDGPTTCIERADAALYYAKHHGRNLVCHFDELVLAGELTAKAGDGGAAELF
ncbi:MAG: GGDEF domain-containing protein [Steroidobacteraceae bacterium]